MSKVGEGERGTKEGRTKAGLEEGGGRRLLRKESDQDQRAGTSRDECSLQKTRPLQGGE